MKATYTPCAEDEAFPFSRIPCTRLPNYLRGLPKQRALEYIRRQRNPPYITAGFGFAFRQCESTNI